MKELKSLSHGYKWKRGFEMFSSEVAKKAEEFGNDLSTEERSCLSSCSSLRPALCTNMAKDDF